MQFLRDQLGQANGGVILDLGTGRGQTVRLLIDSFLDWASIVGADIEDPLSNVDQDLLEKPEITWLQIDGKHLPFFDSFFDTVSIANVLHHLKQTEIVSIISEALRVLKPQGRMILIETVCDGLSEAQMTQVCFHHWRGEIDRLMGREHNPTFKRSELMSLVRSFGLKDMEVGEYTPIRDDCDDRTHLQELAGYMNHQLDEVRGRPEYSRLRARYDELVARMYETGFLGATSIVLIGYKE